MGGEIKTEYFYRCKVCQNIITDKLDEHILTHDPANYYDPIPTISSWRKR